MAILFGGIFFLKKESRPIEKVCRNDEEISQVDDLDSKGASEKENQEAETKEEPNKSLLPLKPPLQNHPSSWKGSATLVVAFVVVVFFILREHYKYKKNLEDIAKERKAFIERFLETGSGELLTEPLERFKDSDYDNIILTDEQRSALKTEYKSVSERCNDFNSQSYAQSDFVGNALKLVHVNFDEKISALDLQSVQQSVHSAADADTSTIPPPPQLHQRTSIGSELEYESDDDVIHTGKPLSSFEFANVTRRTQIHTSSDENIVLGREEEKADELKKEERKEIKIIIENNENAQNPFGSTPKVLNKEESKAVMVDTIETTSPAEATKSFKPETLPLPPRNNIGNIITILLPTERKVEEKDVASKKTKEKQEYKDEAQKTSGEKLSKERMIRIGELRNLYNVFFQIYPIALKIVPLDQLHVDDKCITTYRYKKNTYVFEGIIGKIDSDKVVITKPIDSLGRRQINIARHGDIKKDISEFDVKNLCAEDSLTKCVEVSAIVYSTLDKNRTLYVVDEIKYDQEPKAKTAYVFTLKPFEEDMRKNLKSSMDVPNPDIISLIQNDELCLSLEAAKKDVYSATLKGCCEKFIDNAYKDYIDELVWRKMLVRCPIFGVRMLDEALHKIEVSKDNENGKIPLYTASSEGRTAVVRLLLPDPEIDVNQAAKYGQTPIEIANRKGYADVDDIVKNHIDPNKDNENGETPHRR